MRNEKSGVNSQKAGLAVLIWILAFQNPLERVWGSFSYIDEFTALIGAYLGLYDIVVVRKGRPSKDQMWTGIPLLVFIAAGLAGNLIYQYQPLKSVMIDLYTNLKFFFAIGTGYYLFASMDWKDLKKTAGWNARLIISFLFVLFLIDRIFHIWPGQVRYGISSAVLFYAHPSYFAGALAFLLVLLLGTYEKKNISYIAMALLMMAFTLRSKAIASAAAGTFLFCLVVILKRQIKVWHLAVLGGVCVLIGLPFIWFYYFSVGLSSVRTWLTVCSAWIIRDYFPIGTGFGTFASSEAAKNFSPVYLIYDMEKYMYAKDNWRVFLTDTFWPIIFGQTGLIGTCAFLTVLFQIGKNVWGMYKQNRYAYVSLLFSFIYLLISSTSEPSFHNAIAIPLAMMVGLLFASKKSGLDEYDN